MTNLHDKSEYIVHIGNLMLALNHRLVLKKVHRVIKFNQNCLAKTKYWLNTKIRKKAKNNFEKYFFKLMNNPVLGKLGKMWGNKEISNFQQQTREEII